jgi:peptidoglycan/xylan/chitin deacetylase (PgdA/CDA1 family)
LSHRKAVVITLDDGYRDNYLYAYPILRKYRVPATIFLATGSIGTGNLFWWDRVGYLVWHASIRQLHLPDLGTYRLESDVDRVRATFKILKKLKSLADERKNRFIDQLSTAAGLNVPSIRSERLVLSWDEVAEMGRNGVDFGAHTVTHPILGNMAADRAKWEIVQSKRDIETRAGKPVCFFAYPDGYFNARIVEMVKDAGFLGACTCDPSWITSGTNPYELGRIIGCDDLDVFKFLLSGLWKDLQSVLRRRTAENVVT